MVEEGTICPICGEYRFERYDDFDICDMRNDYKALEEIPQVLLF